jgi:hypothetical protein
MVSNKKTQDGMKVMDRPVEKKNYVPISKDLHMKFYLVSQAPDPKESKKQVPK